MKNNIFGLILLVLFLRNKVYGHGIPEEEKNEDGIELSIFPWDHEMQLDAPNYVNNLTLNPQFPAHISHIRGLKLGNRHSDFHKYFKYNLSNANLTMNNMTAILMFGPKHQQSKMVIHLQYHQSDDYENDRNKPTFRMTIIGGIIGVTVTNLCSLFGAVFIPIHRRKCYPLVLTFMVGLAVASLAASALMVLLPEALHLHSHEEHDLLIDMETIKLISVFVGAIFFYALEYFIICLSSFYVKGKEIPQYNLEIQNTESDDVISDDTMGKILISDETLMEDCEDTGLKKKTSVCCSCMSMAKFRQANFVKIAPVAWMVLLGDSIHNLMDGLTIGVAFSRSLTVGTTLSISILLEELPHELGDFAILLSSGFSVKAALCSNFLSACSAYVGLVIGLGIGKVPTGADFVLAVTSGFFLYISLADMLPELRNEIKKASANGQNTLPIFIIQNLGFIIGFLCILTLIMIESFIKI